MENNDIKKPKFNVGDWVVDIDDGDMYYINKKRQNTYELINCDADVYNSPHYVIDPNHKLWSINDAKNGDILYADSTETILLFKEIEDAKIFYHCYYSDDSEGFHLANDIEWFGTIFYADDIHPATTEQCELLMRKMKEAYCEWDENEKRVIRKTEWFPQEGDFFRKKGTDKPLYQLYMRLNFAYFSYLEITDKGYKLGEIKIDDLLNDYAPIQKPNIGLFLENPPVLKEESLTEFEQTLAKIIRNRGGWLPSTNNNELKEEAKELFSVAIKHIIAQIDFFSLFENAHPHWSIAKSNAYEKGVLEIIDKIRKIEI